MTIKTVDGTESVGSQGQANLNTVLGAVGTIGTLMGGGGLLGSRMGNNGFGYGYGYAPQPACTPFVSREELNLVQQIQARDVQLASKDAALALKESEAYTDKKLVEVYTNLDIQLGKLRDKVDANKAIQDDVNLHQATYNANANATLRSLQGQISALDAITKKVIPSSNVCDTGCCCNG